MSDRDGCDVCGYRPPADELIELTPADRDWNRQLVPSIEWLCPVCYARLITTRLRGGERQYRRAPSTYKGRHAR